MQHKRLRPRRLARRQKLRRAVGNVLELEGDHIDRVGETLQRVFVLIGRHGRGAGDLRRRRVRIGAIDVAAIAEPRRRHRRHAAQLAAAHDADRRARRKDLAAIGAGEGRRHHLRTGRAHALRPAGLSATAAVCFCRRWSSALAIFLSCSANTEAASSAALMAPASPIASVPTGMPAGICTMESRLSMPLSSRLSTGTPNTGSAVIEAVMPGRCAAPPAPAIITFKPRPRARRAYSYSRSGVRWAETIRTSWMTPRAS